MSEVVADHDASILRRGWPVRGAVTVTDGDTTYDSPYGATWRLLGIRDGSPIWQLLDPPFRTAETGQNPDGTGYIKLPKEVL